MTVLQNHFNCIDKEWWIIISINQHLLSMNNQGWFPIQLWIILYSLNSILNAQILVVVKKTFIFWHPYLILSNYVYFQHNLDFICLLPVSPAFHLSMSVIPFCHCTDIIRHLFAPPPLFSLPFPSPFMLFISQAPTTTGQYGKRQPKIHAFSFISPWRQPCPTQILPPHPLLLPALTTSEQPAMSSHSFSFSPSVCSAWDAVLPDCVRLRCSLPSCIPCPPEERRQKHYKACKNSLSRIASPLQRNGIAEQCK